MCSQRRGHPVHAQRCIEIGTLPLAHEIVSDKIAMGDGAFQQRAYTDVQQRFCQLMKDMIKGLTIVKILVAIISLSFLFPSVEVRADGDEKLGPPNIRVESGTGIVAAGIGLFPSLDPPQKGTIQIDVPVTNADAIKQVLLYWEGSSSESPPAGETIRVNDIRVPGIRIGSSATNTGRTFRADITRLRLVGPGSNMLTVIAPNDLTTNGAGVLVIYDDDSSPADIQIRDGHDFAVRNTTEPQTFIFAKASFDRTATLAMFFSGIRGMRSGDGFRPTTITISILGQPEQVLDNRLNSCNGEEWDTLTVPVSIPAGASKVTVQALSRDSGVGPMSPCPRENGDNVGSPASLVWNAAALSVPPIPGTITIIKETLPEGMTAFNFTATGTGVSDFSLIDDGTTPNRRTFSNLLPGTFEITETVPSGWQLMGLNCVSNGTGTSAMEDPATATATITLALGGSVTCTFIDTQAGSITIIKEALPEGMTSFPFTTTGTGLSNFSLMDTGTSSNSQTFSNLLPGTFAITETVPAGWQLSALSCMSMGTGTSAAEDLATATATITLAAGGSVRCTFTNIPIPPSSITIIKEALPEGATPFDFTGDLGAFALVDDGTASNRQTFSNLTPGIFVVTETVPAGWILSGLTCVDADNGTTTAGATATIDLDAGETVTCTFTDTQPSAITIIKEALPEGATVFPFIGDLGSFSLVDDGTVSNSQTFSDLTPGTFVVAETVPAGWELAGLNCVSTGSGTSAVEDPATATATITLALGGSVTCTFTDTQAGTITIIKEATPEGTTAFAFTTTGAGLTDFSLIDDGTGSSTQTFSNLTPGMFVVTETVPTGWQLTGLNCVSMGTGTSAAEDPAKTTATITLGAGGDVTCTFTDTQEASITVIKEALPEGMTAFPFSTAGTGLSDFSLIDDGTGTNTQTFSNLLPGTFAITETVPAGWELAGLNCASMGTGTSTVEDPATATATITLALGGSVTCTFTDTQAGSITIIKEALPEGMTSFPFTTTGTGLSNFSLMDTGTSSNSQTFSNLLPGTFAITETVPAGWQLSALSCMSMGTGTSAAEDLATATTTITLAAGGSVRCTFTDNQAGSLTIIKEANPEGATAFSFTATGPGVMDFSLQDTGLGSNSQTFANLAPGAFVITETVPAGWNLSGVCTDPDNGTVVTGNLASIDLDAGEAITCTFTNTQAGTIVIVKDTVPDAGQDFTFTDDIAAPNTFTLDDDSEGTLSNTQTFSGVAPGTFTVTETAVAGVAVRVSCSDADNGTTTAGATATIDLDAGESITCTFTNETIPPPPGSITIIKEALPEGATVFPFTGDLGAFSLVDDGTASNTQTFSNLTPGTFVVTETVPAGWILSGITCTDPDNGTTMAGTTATIDLAAGERITCTFTNETIDPPPGSITIIKDALPDDATSFSFSGALGAFSLVDDGSGTNRQTFNVPPGTYTVTELVPADWLLSGITCVDADNGTTTAGATATIDLAAGEVVTCTFTNVKGRDTTVALTKTGPATVMGMETVVYRLTVENTGDNPAADVVVVDTLPAAVLVTQVEVSPPATCTGPTAGEREVRCELGTLAVDASVEVTITVTAPEVQQEISITNTATVTAANAPPQTQQISTIVTPTSLPNVVIRQTDDPDPVTEGGLLTYRLIVENMGDALAENVRVTDNLPAGTEGITGEDDFRCEVLSTTGVDDETSPRTDICRPMPIVGETLGGAAKQTGGPELVVVLGDLEAGESRTIRLFVSAPSGPNCESGLTNEATVTADNEPPENQGDIAKEETDCIPTPPGPDVTIKKTATVNPVIEAEPLIYRLFVGNLGNTSATNVTVTDDLPLGATFQGCTSPDIPDFKDLCSIDEAGRVVTANLGDLDPLEKLEFRITVNAPTGEDCQSGLTSTVTNEATVTATNEPDANHNNNTISEDTVCRLRSSGPDVTIMKTDVSDPVTPKGILTYGLTVKNVGRDPATNVTVTEVLPKNTTFLCCLQCECSLSRENMLTIPLGDLGPDDEPKECIIQVRTTTTSCSSDNGLNGLLVNEAEVIATNELPENRSNNMALGVTECQESPLSSQPTASRDLPADFKDPVLNYVLIGSPLELSDSDSDPETVLRPNFGRPGEDLEWRLFRFDPTLGDLGEYVEFSPDDPDRSAFNFEPGRGFWLITRTGGTLELEGTQNDPLRPVEIPLEPGRNLIATPFNFSSNEFFLDWTSCVPPGVSDALFGYEGDDGGYIMKDEMEPMFGYWVSTETDDVCRSDTGPVPFILSIDPNCVKRRSPDGQAAANVLSPIEASTAAGWRAKLSVTAGARADSDN